VSSVSLRYGQVSTGNMNRLITKIIPAKPIVLDLRELDFLNSSGITMLSRFVMEARDRPEIDVQVLASEAVPWHARS
jgi:hypothetical protein